MDLELRHLRLLRTVADAGSISQAAAILGYTQQTVSGQLQRIERHLGEPLFERGVAGVTPTAFGVDVLAQAQDVLTRVAAIGIRRSDAAGQSPPSVRLAATNSPILAGTVARMRAVLPYSTVTVSSVYASSEIVGMLERSEIDAAIAVDYPGMELQHSEAVVHRGIVTEPAFVAIPAGHRLGHRIEIALGDLAEEAWFLTPDDGAGWPGVFYTACRAAGFAPARVHEFLGDRVQLQDMIADGLGVSLVQATTRPASGVLIKPLIGAPVWCRYLLAWRRDEMLDDIVDTMCAAAAAAYRELIASAPHAQSWMSRVYRASTPRSEGIA